MSDLPYKADYAKRTSKCRELLCKFAQSIGPSTLRIGVLQKSMFHDGDDYQWHHAECFFIENKPSTFSQISNFNNLKHDDQVKIKTMIRTYSGDCSSQGSQGKKRHSICLDPRDNCLSSSENKIFKKDNDSGCDIGEVKREDEITDDVYNNEEEMKIEEQTKLIDAYKVALEELTTKEMKDLLIYNYQEKHVMRYECLNRLADMLAFGALGPCTTCETGQLVLDSFGYICTGDATEWTKCANKTTAPVRHPVNIPKELEEKAVFQNYDPKTNVRLFHSATPVYAMDNNDSLISSISDFRSLLVLPLKNLEFYMLLQLEDKEVIKEKIFSLGGLVVGELTDSVAAVISTQDDLEMMCETVHKIREKKIGVVESSFLNLIDPAKGTIHQTLQILMENNIADWGSDPRTRIPQDVYEEQQTPELTYDASDFYKFLRIKGGTAVYPESELEDVAHVYRDGDGDHYSVVLCRTEIVQDKNSFYILQVLEDDDKKKYWLFKWYGRIGTNRGRNYTTEYDSVEEAIVKFKDDYERKTKNCWEARDAFIKRPGSYYPVEMNYTDEKITLVGDHCTLPLPVQKLVMYIFDTDIMKSTLQYFKLDAVRLPLGNLSKNHITIVYNMLLNLRHIMQKGLANQIVVKDATNRFFTLIPHDFGQDSPPLLDNINLIDSKILMLEFLLDIEIAYNILTSVTDESCADIEVLYKKLKTDITPLDKNSEEFAIIQDYVKNSHGPTHKSYTLEIQEVFKVNREGEEERFEPYKKLGNRRLLWHGSRSTNYAGILPEGLRLRPAHVEASGEMFGKGVYFAEAVSKSANYCAASPAHPLGLLLLCDVALGHMKTCYKSDKADLPGEFQSKYGVGKWGSDPAENCILEGAEVPIGALVYNRDMDDIPPKEQRPDIYKLSYNEYIVFNIEQINIKYLLQVKFHYCYE